jgi:hypothetical protein
VRNENPSKSPFTKGDFLFPLLKILKKGRRGDFWTNASIESNSVNGPDFDVALRRDGMDVDS